MPVSQKISTFLLLLMLGIQPLLPVYAADAGALTTPSRDAVPANGLGQSVLAKAQTILDRADSSHYQHNSVPAGDQVSVKDGACACNNDCSGFVSYLLNAVSPDHYRQIHDLEPDHNYPQAKIYTQFFRSLNAASAQGGWQLINSLNELRPGDLIAWQKPSATGNTGHVMIVAETPRAFESCYLTGGGLVRYAPIEVIDSSSVRHFPPEELPPLAHQTQRDGVGKGYVRIIVDDRDQPIGYWEGTYWGEGEKPINRPTMTDAIGFARMVSF